MATRTNMLVDQMGRRRVQHRFDLNLNKEDEHQLHEMIRSLKKKRSFMGVVRDGIRLILDLRQGQTDVLRELFPWVFEQAVLNSEDTLQSQLDELKQLIAQRAALPTAESQPVFSSPPIEPDDFEDDLVIEEKPSDFNPIWNLMLKGAKIRNNYSHLNQEVIWYGIRTELIEAESALKCGSITHQQIAEGVDVGKINIDKLPKSVTQEVKKLPAQGSPKKLEGADIALSEPTFDDIELDF